MNVMGQNVPMTPKRFNNVLKVAKRLAKEAINSDRSLKQVDQVVSQYLFSNGIIATMNQVHQFVDTLYPAVATETEIYLGSE